MSTPTTSGGPDPMTPEWSQDLAEVRMSPYWQAENGDAMERRDTFIEQAAQYATYDDLPGDLKATFQAARLAAGKSEEPDNDEE